MMTPDRTTLTAEEARRRIDADDLSALLTEIGAGRYGAPQPGFDIVEAEIRRRRPMRTLREILAAIRRIIRG